MAQCCEKKVKKQGLSIGFFHVLHGEYLLKEKVLLVHIPEWKFKVDIARNTTFEGHLGSNVCANGVKNVKKLIFKNFTLVSQFLKSQN